MAKEVSFIGAFGLGMATMYFLDPIQGRRRRAMALDQINSLSTQVRRFGEAGYTDAANRGIGTVHQLRAHVDPRSAQVDDERLNARVRARMGRFVSHAHAVRSRVEHGRVHLSGPILADEVEPLLSAIGRMQGVRDVESDLEVHESPERVPALQGDPRRRDGGARLGELPAVRLAEAVAGVVIGVRGLRASNAIVRSVLTYSGAALLGWAMMLSAEKKRELTRVFGR